VNPFGLYLVLTDPVAGYERCAEAAVAEGVRYVQLRMKFAPREDVVRLGRRLRDVVRGSATRLIVNDDPMAATEAGADGVHLGQGDLPVAEARRFLRVGALVGLSTHDEEHAARAEALGPDYIGVGPIWTTPTKQIPDPVLGVERAARIATRARIPAVGIGGIDAARLPAVLAAGIENFAVVRHVCGSPDPRAAIAELMGIWRAARPAPPAG
jgi:thiamine-phosphate pyrophosphorylase